MSQQDHPGQGNPRNNVGQSQWGSQPNLGYPQQGPQGPGQGHWQNAPGSAQNWGDRQATFQGWNGGPGGKPPQGQPPSGGRKGAKVGIIIAISVLAVAVIGLVVWLAFFNDNDRESPNPVPATSSMAVETPSSQDQSTEPSQESGDDEEPSDDDEPSDSDTGETVKPTSAKTPVQKPRTTDPGTKPGVESEITAADLPQQIGDWKLSEFGFLMYSTGDISAPSIVLIDFGTDTQLEDFIARELEDVEEFNWGFCGASKSSAGMVLSCFVHPGKKPQNLASVSGTDVSKAELMKVAKAIAAYK